MTALGMMPPLFGFVISAIGFVGLLHFVLFKAERRFKAPLSAGFFFTFGAMLFFWLEHIGVPFVITRKVFHVTWVVPVVVYVLGMRIAYRMSNEEQRPEFRAKIQIIVYLVVAFVVLLRIRSLLYDLSR